MSGLLGLANLKRKLDRLPAATIPAMVAAMEKQADAIVAKMKAAAPVDTGTLRDSIGWSWGRAPKGTIALGTVRGKASARMAITIYAGGGDAFHAVFAEFGTQNMPAKPFFYVTWRASKVGARRALRKAARDETKRAAR